MTFDILLYIEWYLNTFPKCLFQRRITHIYQILFKKKVAEDRFNNFIFICVIQDIIQNTYKKFTYEKKKQKKPGDRVNFKILCHENIKINFARSNIVVT